MNSALTFLLENLKLIRIRDILDVAIVAFVIYKGTKLVRETRAVQLIKGIIILLLAMQVSGWLSLNAINFLLVNTGRYGCTARGVSARTSPCARKGGQKQYRQNFKFVGFGKRHNHCKRCYGGLCNAVHKNGCAYCF